MPMGIVIGFSDEKIFRFFYARDSFLKAAMHGQYPPEFQVNKWSLLDDYAGNETFINYTMYDGQEMQSHQVLVEVQPNFLVFPNPKSENYRSGLKNFDFSFILMLAEYRRADFKYRDSTYQLYLRPFDARGLSDDFKCYVRVKQAGVPFISKPEDIVSFPSQRLIIANDVFDVKTDPYGKECILTYENSKEAYTASIDILRSKTQPFVGRDLLSGRKINFPSSPDKRTILHFWGSWCGPCKEDMPDLVNLHVREQDHTDFVGIAAEQSIDSFALKEILRGHSISWAQIPDLLSDPNGIANQYQIDLFPTYCIITPGKGITLRTTSIEKLIAAFDVGK